MCTCCGRMLITVSQLAFINCASSPNFTSSKTSATTLTAGATVVSWPRSANQRRPGPRFSLLFSWLRFSPQKRTNFTHLRSANYAISKCVQFRFGSRSHRSTDFQSWRKLIALSSCVWWVRGKRCEQEPKRNGTHFEIAQFADRRWVKFVLFCRETGATKKAVKIVALDDADWLSGAMKRPWPLPLEWLQMSYWCKVQGGGTIYKC